MRSPIAKIYIKSSNRDISEFIEHFSYERCVEKDDLVQLKVKQDYAFDLIDDPEIVSGKLITFQYGFIGELLSPVREARITDIDVDYGDKIILIIKALDRGQDMKKGGQRKVWNNITSSGIVSEIADKYGLNPLIDPTYNVWKSLPQGNRTDFEMIQWLCNHEKDGSFRFYISSTDLVFERAKYEKKARFQYTYGVDIVKFSPKYCQSRNKSGFGNQTAVCGFDPKSKTALNSLVNPANVGDNQKLGDHSLISFNVNGDQKNGGVLSGLKTAISNGAPANGNAPVSSTGVLKNLVSGSKAGTDNPTDKPVAASTGIIVAPHHDVQESMDFGSKHHKKNSGPKVLMADLTVEGNPLFNLTDIVTIAGVAKKHLGNWHIEKITDTVSGGSAYVTKIEFSRNGTAKAMSTAAVKSTDNVNKTTGDKSGKTEKLVRYSVNGVQQK